MNRRLCFSFLTLLCASSAYAGQTGYYYKSEPGDPLGNGREAFYTDTQQPIQVGPVSGPGVWPNTVIAQIYHVGNSDLPSFLLSSFGTTVHFSAPQGMELFAGDYENAVPFPWTGTTGPVLWWNSPDTCSGIKGSFSIKEAVYDYSNYSLTRFAADFVQRCEGSAAASYGYLRYNSDVPFPDGVPPSIASDTPLSKAGCFEATRPDGGDVSLHVVNGSGSYSHEWSAVVIEPAPSRLDPFDRELLNPTPTASCTDLPCISSLPAPGTLDAPTLLASSDTLSFDHLTVGGIVVNRTVTGTGETFGFDLGLKETAKVTLKTTNAMTGEVQEAVMKACVIDSPPEIEILSPRNGEGIVGNSLFVHIKVTDHLDPNPSYTVTVAGRPVSVEQDKPTHVRLPMQSSGEGPIYITVRASDSANNKSTSSVMVYQRHDMRPE